METITIPITEVVPKRMVVTLNVKVAGVWLYFLRLKLALWFLWAASAIASAVGRLEIEIKV